VRAANDRSLRTIDATYPLVDRAARPETTGTDGTPDFIPAGGDGAFAQSATGF